jgi:hypothetical protein
VPERGDASEGAMTRRRCWCGPGDEGCPACAGPGCGRAALPLTDDADRAADREADERYRARASSTLPHHLIDVRAGDVVRWLDEQAALLARAEEAELAVETWVSTEADACRIEIERLEAELVRAAKAYVEDSSRRRSRSTAASASFGYVERLETEEARLRTMAEERGAARRACEAARARLEGERDELRFRVLNLLSALSIADPGADVRTAANWLAALLPARVEPA